MLFEMTSKIVNKSENVQRKFSLGNIPTCPPHPPTCPLYVTQWLYHIVNYALLGAHLRLFSQQRSYCFFCFFLSFSLSFFFWKAKVCMWGGGGGLFYHYCTMLSTRVRPRLWIWTVRISGFSEVHIATSQITTALISSKNNAKTTFLEKIQYLRCLLLFPTLFYRLIFWGGLGAFI